MKITSVEEGDNGEWECSITGKGHSGHLAETKGFIHVNVTLPPLTYPYHSSGIKVISKNHNNLEIQQEEEMVLTCTTNVEALACVFRGPNGLTYSMMKGAK